ncbi:hypothetical protein SK128_004454, partial [Halocaridina rubra]
EITRIYGIRDRESDGATEVGVAVWDRLPYQLQEILAPLFTSKYTVAASNSRAASLLPTPIYGSAPAKTFHQWLASWTCSMVDLLRSEITSQVFSSCKPILRRDVTTAMFLLSPLLVCIFCESEENHTMILEEVLAVMKRKPEEKETEHNLMSPEHQQLAIQTVFSALDYLSKWSQKQRQSESVDKKSRMAFTPSPELRQVNEFIEKIPADLLAQTSFKCKSYSRALLHIESYLKDHPDELKEHLHFLQ